MKIAAGLAAAVLLAGCSSGGEPHAGASASLPEATTTQTSYSAPATMIVSGVLTLSGSQASFDTTQGTVSGSPCGGGIGYEDLHLNAQVIVTDSTGATIALGSIDRTSRSVDSTSIMGPNCDLYFTVADVPRGKGFYGVKVAGRTGPQYTEAQVSTPPLKLTLQ